MTVGKFLATNRRITTFSVLLLLVLGACEIQTEEEVDQDDEGALVLGTTEVSDTSTRGVSLGNRVLVLDGFRGTIRLNGGDSDNSNLEFTKRARGQNESSARETLDLIEIEESGGDEEYTYRIRSNRERRSAVDISGEVPPNTNLRIHLQSGPVTLSGIDGPVDLEVNNGAIRIAGASESVTVRGRNGSVELGMRDLPQDAELDVQTQNGDVHFTMPGQSSARVEARTQAGDIRVENLDFTNRQLSPSGAGAHFTGDLGTGQTPVRLETENGSIRLSEGMVERITPEADTLYRNELFPEIEEPTDTLPGLDDDQDALDNDTLPNADTPPDTSDMQSV